MLSLSSFQIQVDTLKSALPFLISPSAPPKTPEELKPPLSGARPQPRPSGGVRVEWLKLNWKRGYKSIA